MATGKEWTTLPGRKPVFSPVGKVLTTRVVDTLTLWDSTTRKEIWTCPVAGIYHWNPVFSPDGRYLVLPTTTGKAKFWEVATGKERTPLEGSNLVWAKDSTVLATSLSSGVIKLWDAATGRERATLQGFNQPSAEGEFSPDGRLFLSYGFEYRLKPDGLPDLEPAKGAQGSRPRVLNKLPVEVRLWDAANGKELARLPGKTRLCRSSVFSPDGQTVAYQRSVEGSSYEYELEAVLWDVAAGTERLVLRQEGGIDGIRFTPDGQSLVGFVGRPETVTFWDAATGKLLSTLPGGPTAGVKDASPGPGT